MNRLADVDPDRLRPDPVDVASDAQAILDDVQERGDAAVREATRRFDDADIDDLEVQTGELAEAAKRVDDDLRAALERLRDRVAAVQRSQRPADPGRVEPAPGVEIEVAYRPLARVGCYVPGGRAAYPSTVLMTATPARVAGVDEVVVATPPGPDGAVPDATLAACHLADVDRVLRIGGVQAVAALAFGTETVPRVDKVVGPGNAYVDAAKGLLHGRAGIDLPAGPTELVVVADDADPAWVAADLLAQAEHDPAAQAILIALDEELAEAVEGRIDDPVGDVEVLVADDRDRIRDWLEVYAPEHLHLVVDDPGDLARVAAGTVFVGPHASPVLGDYATGAGHVLPTGGAARWVAGLGVDDFLVRRVVQRVDEDGFEALANDAIRLADAEGLTGHADALEVRR